MFIKLSLPAIPNSFNCRLLFSRSEMPSRDLLHYIIHILATRKERYLLTYYCKRYLSTSDTSDDSSSDDWGERRCPSEVPSLHSGSVYFDTMDDTAHAALGDWQNHVIAADLACEHDRQWLIVALRSLWRGIGAAYVGKLAFEIVVAIVKRRYSINIYTLSVMPSEWR